MKYIILAAVALTLSGCGAGERIYASVTGWSVICVEGVSYIQFVSGATVQYTTDGKIKLCKQ